jgi:hypothetical protein
VVALTRGKRVAAIVAVVTRPRTWRSSVPRPATFQESAHRLRSPRAARRARDYAQRASSSYPYKLAALHQRSLQR